MRPAQPVSPMLALLVLTLVGAALPARASNQPPTVDALSVSPTPLPASSQASITCSGSDSDGTITQLRIIVSGGLLPGGALAEYLPITPGASVTASVLWSTPPAGDYTVRCGVADSGGTFGGSLVTWSTLAVTTVAPVGAPPALLPLTLDAAQVLGGGRVHLTATVSDPDGDPLDFLWSAADGAILGTGPLAEWELPLQPGHYVATLTVSDGTGNSAVATAAVDVVRALIAAPLQAEATLTPERIALDSSGTIWVTSGREGAVVALTPEGARLRTIPFAGHLGSIAVATDGTLWVGDLDAGSVTRLDALGRRVGMLGRGAGELRAPADLAIAANGDVWVADADAARVARYAADGRLLQSFPLPDTRPTGVALSADGSELFVTDGLAGRVLVLSQAGVPLRTIGSFGTGAGRLTRPGGLALGQDGTLFVADLFQSNAAIFATDGSSGTVGAYGDTAAAGQLQIPVDVAVDRFGRLLVTSAGTNRVEVFDLIGGASPRCVGDSDCDGLPDLWELAHGLDPHFAGDAWRDADGDGLPNALEYRFGTDPLRGDTDGDGLSDLEELDAATDPLDPASRDLLVRVPAELHTGPTLVAITPELLDAGGPATFAWRLLGGPERVRPTVAADGRLTFPAFVPGTHRLSVRASRAGRTGPASVVRVTIDELPPVADAGVDVGARVGERVGLDGRFSTEPNRQSLSFRWSQLDGAPVLIAGADTARPAFVAGSTGLHRFSLVVTDVAGLSSAPAFVDVLVEAPGDHLPVARAVVPSLVEVGAPIALDASASLDVDGAPVTVRWSLSGVGARIDDPAALVTTFTADAPGRYELTLVANDGLHDGQVTRFVVQAHTLPAAAPLAAAGADLRALTGVPIRLDGSASHPGLLGDARFTWRQLEGPTVALTDEGTFASASFVALEAGAARFRLASEDAAGVGTSDDVVVTVDEPGRNAVPVAVALVIGTLPGSPGMPLVIDASRSSDADRGARRHVTWTQRDGPRLDLPDPHALRNKVRPTAPGAYVLELTVDDGIDRSAAVRVEFSVVEENP